MKKYSNNIEIFGRNIIVENKILEVKSNFFTININRDYSIAIYVNTGDNNIDLFTFPEDFVLVNGSIHNISPLKKTMICFNEIHVNNVHHLFDYRIDCVMFRNEAIIILLDIPYEDNSKDNLYAISFDGKLLWRVESIDKFLPHKNNQCYCNIHYVYDKLIVSDFSGKVFEINLETGKIIKQLPNLRW